MIAKWIIIGFVVLTVTPVTGQIPPQAQDRIDSLFHALDTPLSQYRSFNPITHPDSTYWYLNAYLKWQDDLHKIAADTLPEDWSLTDETQMSNKQAAEQQREIEALKQEKKLTHLSNYFIISLLMLALMLSSFFFVRNRMKRKLAESELRNQKLVAQQFRRELQGKQKDLTNLALEIARKNELFIKTNQTLLEIDLDSLPVKQRKKIQQLIQFNANQLRINEDLEELLVNIEQVNTDFFEKLNKLAPDLSPSEKQICAFLRLNLSNKEIASIRNISPKSVEMARYRLRKKLPIHTGDDIYAFIQSI
jgi:DNA-binding CsgD family transcriptional regulator/vacuolar-type H+-ATPase catalytic subunit A/Vma1